MTVDPWPVRLFPTTSAELLLSTDLPSPPDVRPFGLAMTTLVVEDTLPELTGLRYDPVRQLNVDPAGEPVVAAPGLSVPATATDTRYDNQWLTDRD